MQNHYDDFAEIWDKTRQRSWAEFDILHPHLRWGDRVLDLGCGNARLRQFLDDKKIARGAYFGLDQSEKLLQIARKRFPADHFFVGDLATKFPFGDQNFEVLTAIASFHHLLRARDQKNFLTESARVLKKNGIFFLTTWRLPQRYFWPNFWRGRVFSGRWIIPFGAEKRVRIYRKMPEKFLRKTLTKSGFRVLQSGTNERNYWALAQKI